MSAGFAVGEEQWRHVAALLHLIAVRAGAAAAS
jgi:hypothetical protein